MSRCLGSHSGEYAESSRGTRGYSIDNGSEELYAQNMELVFHAGVD